MEIKIPKFIFRYLHVSVLFIMLFFLIDPTMHPVRFFALGMLTTYILYLSHAAEDAYLDYKEATDHDQD